jgi:hypothetical protein
VKPHRFYFTPGEWGEHSAFSIQHSAFSIQHSAFWHLAFGIWWPGYVMAEGKQQIPRTKNGRSE